MVSACFLYCFTGLAKDQPGCLEKSACPTGQHSILPFSYDFRASRVRGHYISKLLDVTGESGITILIHGRK